ncbi:hypothetical protein [Bradyrhizobium sp.]|uniref:hypothetical protein n=1 Tax=Bradyrhizobium sp. TaxID=376 RepID=UPI0023A2F06B|nr:hypothetical protein [Bradyrhizobium sp.]MDE1935921.1 hypothetical protein [Bradyrhizobium sp.]
MILDHISPVSEYAYEAILFQEPAEDPHIRRFQFPHRVFLRTNGAKLLHVNQRPAAEEGIEEIIDLFGYCCFSQPVLRFCAFRHFGKPTDEVGRAIEQSQLLLARMHLDLKSRDGVRSDQFFDCRHTCP